MGVFTFKIAATVEMAKIGIKKFKFRIKNLKFGKNSCQ